QAYRRGVTKVSSCNQGPSIRIRVPGSVFVTLCQSTYWRINGRAPKLHFMMSDSIRKRMRIALPALLLLLAGGAGILTTSRAADDKKTAPARPALTVTTAPPESTRLPLGLAANGNVAAWQEAV